MNVDLRYCNIMLVITLTALACYLSASILYEWDLFRFIIVCELIVATRLLLKCLIRLRK